jgi:motility quorum-sensing regulator / GCU-specific mRNA interferase toxin
MSIWKSVEPHYDLKAIITQMIAVEAMNLTLSAVEGIRGVGMLKAEALEVVRTLSHAGFYKSMTTHKSHQIWQDVYHADWRGKQLYVKFQQAGEYFIVSFKER